MEAIENILHFIVRIKEFYMKRNKIVSIIGLLIITVSFVAIAAGCSSTYKIEGVWKVEKAVTTTTVGTGTPTTDTTTYPIKDLNNISTDTYYCFTKKNIVYEVTSRSGVPTDHASEANGKFRSVPMLYDVCGDVIVFQNGSGKTTFKIKKDVATLTTVETTGSGIYKTVKTTVLTLKKSKDIKLKEVEALPEGR